MTTRKPRPGGLAAALLAGALAGAVPSDRSLVAQVDTVPVGVVRDIYPDWSPDGLRLVFQSNRAGPVDQIYVVELASNVVRQLTHDPLPKWDARWSPDGSTIVYTAGDDAHRMIRVMDASGANPRDLIATDHADYQPSWLPDGSGILFDSDRDNVPGSAIINREIYALALATGQVTRLTRYPDWDTFASVSPDGSRIVWRRVVENFDSTRNAEIFVMNRDGSGVRRLTDDPAFDSYPAWSPDSRKILFSSNRGGDHYEDFNIYWINADGTGLERLTETMHEVEQIRARFSPDGSRIVFNRQYLDGRIHIHIMTAPRAR